jgi:hypothetical protein
MTLIAIGQAISAANSSDRNTWVTLESQLPIVSSPITRKVCEALLVRDQIPLSSSEVCQAFFAAEERRNEGPKLLARVTKPLVKVTKRVDREAIKLTEATEIAKIANIVAQYAFEAPWYTSLEKMGLTSQLVPRLPADLIDFLNLRCPEELSCQLNPDGTQPTIGEACTLMVVLEELGTMNQFAKRCIAYFTQEASHDQSLHFRGVQFRGLSYGVQRQYGDFLPESTHWILKTNDTFPTGGKTNSLEQAHLMQTHKWQIPSSRDTMVAIWLKKMAIEDPNCEQEGDDGDLCTLARIWA